MSIVQYNNRPAPFPWLPAALGQPYWDASDLSTMFQDTAGLVPASAPGQPIALMRDKSRHGINLIQPTVAARPTLARMPETGRRNLLLASNEADNIHTKNFTLTAVSDGLVTQKCTASATLEGVYWCVAKVWPAATYVNQRVTLSVYVRPSANRYIYISSNASGAQSNVGSVWRYDTTSRVATSIRNPNAQVSTLNVIEVSGGLYRLELSIQHNAEAGGKSFGVFCTDEIVSLGASTALYNAVNGGANGFTTPPKDFFTGSWQLDLGSSATPYQKVTNAFDVMEAGVPDVWSLFRDPIDDALNANLPAGTYTRINVSPEQVISFDEGIVINASVNILRQPYTSWTSYINRTLTSAEKSAIIAWWASR